MITYNITSRDRFICTDWNYIKEKLIIIFKNLTTPFSLSLFSHTIISHFTKKEQNYFSEIFRERNFIFHTRKDGKKLKISTLEINKFLYNSKALPFSTRSPFHENVVFAGKGKPFREGGGHYKIFLHSSAFICESSKYPN